MTTLEEVEKLYEAVLEDADKGDYAASMFLKHCDPYEWLSVEERAKAVAKAENDVDSDTSAPEVTKASRVDYAEMHREEMALLKVKRRGRKKTRAKNRRLRENRDKASREKKRELRKETAKKNEKKNRSKRERKRFSPISKEMRVLHESLQSGFSLK